MGIGLGLSMLASCRTEPARPAVSPGQLKVSADVAAWLLLDGSPAGELRPGGARDLGLEAGEHLVAVVSQGGEARWERVVEIAGAPVEVAVELARDAERVRREYVRIPGGAFDMGCVAGDSECHRNETPRHAVTIGRDFWMMKTEVTVGAYRTFAQQAGRAMPPETDTNEGWRLLDHPIANLTWEDAAAFCAASGGRLPSEAEWEYSARGGQPGRRYVWGDQARPLVGGQKHANVGDERARARLGCPQCGWFDGYDDGHAYSAPVGSFAPNGYGLFDMAGNVSEWCEDWYRERYYEESPAHDPPGSEFGRWRVLRGGSWSMNPVGLRISARGGFPPDRTTDNYGVRCARDVAAP
jgi:formylglycine-generating enzyme